MHWFLSGPMKNRFDCRNREYKTTQLMYMDGSDQDGERVWHCCVDCWKLKLRMAQEIAGSSWTRRKDPSTRCTRSKTTNNTDRRNSKLNWSDTNKVAENEAWKQRLTNRVANGRRFFCLTSAERNRMEEDGAYPQRERQRRDL